MAKSRPLARKAHGFWSDTATLETIQELGPESAAKKFGVSTSRLLWRAKQRRAKRRRNA